MNPLKHFIYPKSRALKRSELIKVYWTLRDFFGHQKWWPGDTALEIIIGAILTQNTAWTNVEKAIQNLKKENKLSLDSLRRIPHKHLARLIRPSGYFNVKAQRLKQWVNFIFDEYGGRLKRMFRERGYSLRKKLLSVKGIGPETADSILLYAGNKPYFVIDAYTKRVFARHRLLPLEESYESWQKLFMSSLPRKIFVYNDFHAQIVAVGKKYCRAKPLCEACPMSRYL